MVRLPDVEDTVASGNSLRQELIIRMVLVDQALKLVICLHLEIITEWIV